VREATSIKCAKMRVIQARALMSPHVTAGSSRARQKVRCASSRQGLVYLTLEARTRCAPARAGDMPADGTGLRDAFAFSHIVRCITTSR
jgi:hypothetical protein